MDRHATLAMTAGAPRDDGEGCHCEEPKATWQSRMSGFMDRGPVTASGVHHRLGQIKPPVGLWRDGLAGLQCVPQARGNHPAEPAGLWRADRNLAVFHAEPRGQRVGSAG